MSTRSSAAFSERKKFPGRSAMSSLRSNTGPRIKYTPDDSPYETITVDKLTPIIGGEVGGVDLRDISNREMDEIHRALAENLVIFFRDQHLSQDQHLDFGRRFGELHIHPAAPTEPGHPELMIIHADKDSFRANGEGWHSDVSCDVEPPMGSILYIRKCPPKGGDTLFANMYAAYDALSDRMKTYLDGLTARRSPGGAHSSGDRQEKPLRQQGLHALHQRHSARRKRGRAALPLRAYGKPAVPVPLPLVGEFDRVLGQPLRPAPRNVGLLAAHPLRQPGDGGGG